MRITASSVITPTAATTLLERLKTDYRFFNELSGKLSRASVNDLERNKILSGAMCAICWKDAVRFAFTDPIGRDGLNFVCWDHWYANRQADGDFNG